MANTANMFGGFSQKVLFHWSSAAYLKNERRKDSENKQKLGFLFFVFFLVLILENQSKSLKNLAV